MEGAATADDIRRCREGIRSSVQWAHGAQVQAGWWTDLTTGKPKLRNLHELCSLIHSELSEGLEAHRKGLNDDKLPDRDGLEVELADALIRLFDLAGSMNLSVEVASWFLKFLSSHTREDGHINPPQNVGEELCLIHEKVSKLSVAFRIMMYPDHNDLVAEKIADVVFSIFLLSVKMDLDVGGAFVAKMDYNAKRADHKIENRKKEGGKAY